jgi:hypothetical protein
MSTVLAPITVCLGLQHFQSVTIIPVSRFLLSRVLQSTSIENPRLPPQGYRGLPLNSVELLPPLAVFSGRKLETRFWARLTGRDDLREQLFVADGMDRLSFVTSKPEGMPPNMLVAKRTYLGFLARSIHQEA